MTADLNTLLIVINLGILGVFMIWNRNRTTDQGSAGPKSTTLIPLASPGLPTETSSVRAHSQPIAHEPAEKIEVIEQIFDFEVVSTTQAKLFVNSAEVGPGSAFFQTIGEVVKGTGSFNQIGQTYKVCFRPEVERGLRNGTFELMNRAQGKQLTAVGGANRIAGNGWLEPAHAERLLALSTLAWQGMAIITAQKFLADINKSLKEIKASIDDLKHLNDAEIEGRLIGWQAYIKQAAERLAGNINDTEKLAIAAQLEQIHRLSLEEYFASEDRLNRRLAELSAALKDKKAKDSTVQDIHSKCASVDREASRLLAFARINVVNMLAQTMRLDFGAEVVLRDNPRLLETSLSEVVKGLDAASDRAKSLPTGFWDTKEGASKNRQVIEDNISALRTKLIEQQETQLQLISSAQDRIARPQYIYFRVREDGQLCHGEITKAG